MRKKRGIKDEYEAFGPSRKDKAEGSLGGAGLREDWELSLRRVPFGTSLRPLSEDGEQVAGHRSLRYSGQV